MTVCTHVRLIRAHALTKDLDVVYPALVHRIGDRDAIITPQGAFAPSRTVTVVGTYATAAEAHRAAGRERARRCTAAEANLRRQLPYMAPELASQIRDLLRAGRVSAAGAAARI